ncbi:MAG: ABC transporter permease subunit [Anaerolineae bacterium]|nr:ABC transporter permease subunit [Anaerolineae bacterium]
MQRIGKISPPTDLPSTEEKKLNLVTLSHWGKALVGGTVFIGQRLLFGVVVLLVIIYLTYLGLEMARGVSIGQAEGLAFIKTVAYLTHLLQGNLDLTDAGTITGIPIPVAEVLPTLLANSLGLLGISLLFATLVGASLGLLAAGHRRSGWSLVIIVVSIVGVSIPSFFAALLLQILMIKWVRQFGSPLLPAGGFGWDRHLVLPMLVLAARPVAQITRITFVTVGEVLDQDFVRVAHSKGLRSAVVIFRHVIRNAAIPILTTVGLSLRFSLSSLPVIELFFGWSGIGSTLLRSISRQDDNLTIALLLSLGVLVILVNLIFDISYLLIDPRLREKISNIHRGDQEKLNTKIRQFLVDWRDILADNSFNRWLKNRRQQAKPVSIDKTLQKNHKYLTNTTDSRRIASERRRTLVRSTLGNLPLMLGTVLLLGLMMIVFFGPDIAPHSPYTIHGLSIEDGELKVPPFAPDSIFPWGSDALGRDIMSLVVVGAQLTLTLAAVTVLARMIIGFVLGVLAGWFNESWLDRLLRVIAEIIAAFPTLLLAMILILAIGIRQGQKPFIIALCFVGWGEVMQLVRGEVMTLRAKPFIESAHSVGLRTPRLITAHILPNLIPVLISIAALEMGATLMLLGELGFIGIFIGGGAFAELDVAMPPYHYSDVPEWGALLSNVRTYARSYPWTTIYPAFAFFVAIVGFNLFGEGMRRLTDKVGMGITRMVNRYTVAAAVLLIVGFNWMQSNTGPMASYRQYAMNFNGRQTLAHIEALADPTLSGRALGTPGLTTAAQYIADQFQSFGLQAGGEKFAYFYERQRSFETLDTVPQLNIDGGPVLVYRQDYAPFPGRNRNLGQAQGRVRFITTAPLNVATTVFGQSVSVLRGLDYSNEIVMVLSAQDVRYVATIPHGGLLVITNNETDLRANRTLSDRDPSNDPTIVRQMGKDIPSLWISEATANQLLQGSGATVADLRLRADELLRNQYIDFATPNRASMSVDGTITEKFTVYHVIGHLPGAAGKAELGGADTQLDNRLIMVLAQYDSPPPDADGLPRNGANNNASGVAVMLETIRTMQESGYQPYKTFLFVAYSGEGTEGGEWVTTPDPERLLQAKPAFINAFDIEAVVELKGLGAGDGEGLAFYTSGSQRLANLFETAAHQVGVKTTRVDEGVDFNLIFEERTVRQGGQEAPTISLSWQGGEEITGTPADTLETISEDKLEKAGRALSLALMILGREKEY